MIYEICTDTWREAPSLNLARESHSSCTVGTRIYIVCGWSYQTDTDTIECLDVPAGTGWELFRCANDALTPR